MSTHPFLWVGFHNVVLVRRVVVLRRSQFGVGLGGVARAVDGRSGYLTSEEGHESHGNDGRKVHGRNGKERGE